ncbi:ring finger [Fusarium agapanthi]|uniref:Ring finger n=1 Tax=Fusarium agapanthi TaxID=1803897 RepID=A0A9P5EBI5_9HYPO|nr:ring finger [Fusarium agapanthi]
MSGGRIIRWAGRGHPRRSGRPQRAQGPDACGPCLGLQFPYTPTEFLHAHGFTVCCMGVYSEEERYASVMDRLKAKVAKSVADQAFYQASYDLLITDKIPAAGLPEGVRDTIIENYKQLHNTAWPKLMYTVQAEKETRIVDPRDVLSIPIYNQPVQIARQVQVTIGDRLENFRVIQFLFMRCGRWFLGYSPGTFIFRYSNPLPFTEELNITPSTMNFTYEGQVPRSSFEHRLRLISLWKPASELFFSEIALLCGRYHKANYPRHEFLRSRAVIGPDTFRDILEDWTSCSQRTNFVFPAQVTKDYIWKHATTQEVAWLILRLKDVPEVYEGVQSPDLEYLLTNVTGLSLQVLAGHWNTQLEAMAWHHFCYGNRRELFIYENQGQSVSLQPSSTVHFTTTHI